MAKRKYKRPDGERLAELNATGMTFKDIAQKFNLSTGAVAGAIRHYKSSNQDRKPFNIDFGKPLEITGNAMIVGDVHVPTTFYEFALLVVTVSDVLNIDTLILAGDWANFDFLSKYPNIMRGVNWEQEREAGEVLINKYLKRFKRIYWIMGNHDRRLSKWVNGQFDHKDMVNLFTHSEKITSSNFGYCNIVSGGEKYLVTHSTEYSVNQLTVADQLAQKNQCHVISHHEHHVAKGFDRFGRYVVINNGGLFDESKMAYAKLDTNKKPSMVNGFTSLVDGVATLWTPYKAYTDWKPILGQSSLN